jgi:hypothetical protein
MGCPLAAEGLLPILINVAIFWLEGGLSYRRSSRAAVRKDIGAQGGDIYAKI